MPIVKPFCALMPAKHLQERVVIRPLENYSPEQIKAISTDNPHSFVHLIDPALDNPYLRGTKQELVYKKITENFEAFIDHQILERHAKPALYVYRILHDDLMQTGIWALTHVDEYLAGRIKKHESTVEKRERLLAEYLQQTGIDANPVLLTYPKDATIERITNKYVAVQPDLDLKLEHSRHQVWAISEEADMDVIIRAFADIPHVYIADGHHRIASMAKMALHKRAMNGARHSGTEMYNYLTTVYMNTHEVKVLEFNRLVRDLGSLSVNDFLRMLAESFDIELSSLSVKPHEWRMMGMYLASQWYVLRLKKELCGEKDPVKMLDVSILQRFVLEPMLQIMDPRSDTRIAFEGGRIPVEDLERKVDSGAFAVAFTLFPVSADQVIAVADAEGVMPPKSTWVEPKFLTGLLTNYFN